MSKRPVRGGRQAILEAETITSLLDSSSQSDSSDCLVVIDSDAATTISLGAEEETGLFRPRLHWISE